MNHPRRPIAALLLAWSASGASGVLGVPGVPGVPGVFGAPGAPAPGAAEQAAGAQAWWAYRPVARPEVPAVKDAAWARSPIDAFILAGLEPLGLEPARAAAREAWIRRITYDLTGLPPAPEEVEAFVADESPDAWERLADRLLASPRHGEKWGRHWLDLVRYAETNGYERDGPKPQAWRYRDYVIRSLNEDKPYDRFAREQIAGDDLEPTTADSIVATGFHRLGLWDDEAADMLQARFDELDDILVTASQAFLGTTMGCARCHEHKADPIPQEDYYRLLAYFQDIPRFGERGMSAEHVLTDLASLRRAPEEVGRIDEAGRPDELAERKDRAAEAPRDLALSVNGAALEPPETRVLLRGSAHAPGAKVEPGPPRAFGAGDPVIPAPRAGARSSGRRRALADWIASSENPLTARVMANRLWQHHFGRGIVRTPSDFGRLGERPTHPELLDWLASELASRGWSLKAMHRVILTSSAYRMSSDDDPRGLAKDPANDRFWRFDLRRLTAEEVRDSVLALSGSLNLAMGGPSVYTEVPREVLHTASMPGSAWGSSPPAERDRRSVYVTVKRSLLEPTLATFDFPDPDSSCAARFATTVPTQALTSLNGDFFLREARRFAERLRREAGSDPAAQARLALRLALSREPSPAEVAEDAAFLRSLAEEEGLGAPRALERYALVVLSLNELLYLD
ncbi:MAG: DUF1553 domain-containing protein [Planctomycetes bacterium]|nr:DUF1553 domain-containing protein [Planctomycetota bacterium]